MGIAQFVRRMGYSTLKPMVMFRPSGDLEVAKRPPQEKGRPTTSPVTVVDRIDVGYRIKYRLRFDDGTVSRCCFLTTFCCWRIWQVMRMINISQPLIVTSVQILL